jgi:predicted RNA-binding protein with RPS1 domain
MKSLAAAPFATDWDGDGDFDMLIGNIEGTVTLLTNVGSKTEPLFSANRELLTATDGKIKVNGDSGPVFEDWDADGLRDLIIGGGDGAVVWYKNTGDANSPKFAAQQTLLPPSSVGHSAVPHGEEPTGPGTRVKVNVVDYDLDGHVDLLVGDFIAQASAPPELSEEEEADLADMKAKVEEYQQQLQDRFEKLRSEFEDDADSQVASDDLQKAIKELQTELDPEGAMDEMMRKYHEMSATSKYHGFVWFYKRLPQSTSVASLSN